MGIVRQKDVGTSACFLFSLQRKRILNALSARESDLKGREVRTTFIASIAVVTSFVMGGNTFVLLTLVFSVVACVPMTIRDSSTCDTSSFTLAVSGLDGEIATLAKAAEDVSTKGNQAASFIAEEKRKLAAQGTLKVFDPTCDVTRTMEYAQKASTGYKIAFDYEKAAINAFTVAASRVYASGAALGLTATSCECDVLDSLAPEIDLFVVGSSQLAKDALAWAEAVAARHNAVSASLDVHFGVSSSYAKLCRTCGHRIDKISLAPQGNNPDGSFSEETCAGLSAQARALIPDCQ